MGFIIRGSTSRQTNLLNRQHLEKHVLFYLEQIVPMSYGLKNLVVE